MKDVLDNISKTDQSKKKVLRKKRKKHLKNTTSKDKPTKDAKCTFNKVVSLTKGRLTTRVKSGLRLNSKRISYFRQIEALSNKSKFGTGINEKLQQILNLAKEEDETTLCMNDAGTQISEHDLVSDQGDVNPISPPMHTINRLKISAINASEGHEHTLASGSADKKCKLVTKGKTKSTVKNHTKKSLHNIVPSIKPVTNTRESVSSTSEESSNGEEFKDFINDLDKTDYLKGYDTNQFICGVKENLRQLYEDNYTRVFKEKHMHDQNINISDEGKWNVTRASDTTIVHEDLSDQSKRVLFQDKDQVSVIENPRLDSLFEAVEFALQSSPEGTYSPNVPHESDPESPYPESLDSACAVISDEHLAQSTSMMNPITYLERTLCQGETEPEPVDILDESYFTSDDEIKASTSQTARQRWSTPRSEEFYSRSPSPVDVQLSLPASQKSPRTDVSPVKKQEESVENVFLFPRKMY